MKSRSPELKMLLDLLLISVNMLLWFLLLFAITIPEYPVIVP